ncbi:MAG TPA: adenine phosphoribosyltransferase [Candidatus Poseidoniales archaeon]|nr:adenine phosphoribosyltransferase [Candidatus Poseidoniales archaeon]
MDDLQRIVASFEASPVVWKDTYAYVVHPLTDGVPRVEADLLGAVVNQSLRSLSDWQMDAILTIESMGLPIAVPLSRHLSKPLIVVRKRSYGFDDEIVLDQSTGYSSGALYINDVREGERIVIYDDMLSTGGTLRPIVTALRKAGAIVVGALVLAAKGDAAERMSKELDAEIRTLVRLDVDDAGVVAATRGYDS